MTRYVVLLFLGILILGITIEYPWLILMNHFYRDEQDVLNNKLAALEKKIIVGGENLLEKAEEQERMLEESAKELDERLKKEEELKKALQEKEVCRLFMILYHLF